MRIDLTDEKLTAYVLGELNENERWAVEHALEDDEQARRTVAELRATVALASEALDVEPAAGLTDEQRTAIARSAEAAGEGDEDGVIPIERRPGKRGWFWMAAAAGVLLCVGGLTMVVFTEGRMQPLSSDVVDGDAAADGMAEDEMEHRRQAARERIDQKLEEQLRAVGYTTDGVTDTSTGRVPLDGQGLEGGVQRPRGRSLSRDSLHPEPATPSVATSADPPFIHDPEQNHEPGHDRESYAHVVHNPFLDAARNPLSTFSIDVDTASYSNVRRYLQRGALPPAGAVRIEELVNYFDYDYVHPSGRDPFAANVEVAGCPWAADHRLVRIGLKGWELERDERPASNLVFLIDVSGSMNPENKLPLLKQAMRMLVHELGPEDRVALAVYAGSSGLVLDSTACDEAGKKRIIKALDRLDAGGSTHGSAGIQLAYDTATANFIDGGVNRVILASDGDFNVGMTSRSELFTLIEDKAASGVFLTVLGFGMGNLQDDTMEGLADKGNGHYAYIDNLNEAQKVLVDEMSATLVTIAKDVKIQVEFNPAEVNAYRLIGYENRLLAAEDFADDTKDAGEIGAGHTVTALYEIVPAGVPIDLPEVDELRYQDRTEPSSAAGSGELMTLKLRYKEPDGDTSKLLSFPVTDDGASYAEADEDFKFAASVAAFGMLLRSSPYAGTATYDGVLELAEEGQGYDPYDYRAEFLELVKIAKRLSR